MDIENPFKTVLVRVTSTMDAKIWEAMGAVPIPGEDGFVVFSGLSSISDRSSIVRTGKVHTTHKGLAFATERILVDFEHPTPRQTVQDIVGPNAVSIKPLESGVLKDWTWVVTLHPTLDPEIQAKELSKDKRVMVAEPDWVRLVKKSHNNERNK